MPRNFPHLDGDTAFPDLSNVDVYKYANANDYERWNHDQMRITVCSVTWDLGEAHVGQRAIEGVGNVVEFNSEGSRDTWFDALGDDECVRQDTKYRRFHSRDEIKLDIPFETLSLYNYIEVMFYPEVQPPLEHGDGSAVTRWYYFIRNIERVAPSTSKCEIMLDVWQTFIYRIDVSYLQLERGHYPMSQLSVDDYLANPVDNTEWLGYTVDEYEVFGELGKVKFTDSVVLNDGDIWACVITSANASGDFGTVHDESNWTLPAATSSTTQGCPAYQTFAVPLSDFDSFIEDADDEAPQFKQTVQGVFFASEKLLDFSSTGTLFGHSIRYVYPKPKTFSLVELSKAQFGYDERYADIAKLYSFPYAAIDLYAEDGAVTRVHVEDCCNAISLICKMSAVFPWVNIDSRLSGIGGGSAGSIVFKNPASYSFTYSGRWYETLRTWQVPIYPVIAAASEVNDYETYWERQQTLTAATNQRANENDSANLLVTNANVVTSARTAVTNINNAAALQDAQIVNNCNFSTGGSQNGYTRTTAISQITAENAQASVSLSSNQITAVAGAAGSVLGLNPGGVVTEISGGVASAQAISANAVIANYLTDATASAAIALNDATFQYSTDATTSRTENNNQASSDVTARNNNATTAQADNSRDVGIGNATRTYNTAVSATNNQVRDARLQAPSIFGSAENGETAVTRPMAYFASVVTQSDAAIAQAGDVFCRYGWHCHRNVSPERFAVMPKFTYWQCSDIWLSSESYIPDYYMDMIRFLLMGGVTVWRRPEDIGRISIYDNAE